VNRKTAIVKGISYAGVIYAVVGWVSEVFHWTDSALLSHNSEYIAIVGFGIYRVFVEKNPYTKKRLISIVLFVGLFWGLLPYLFKIIEPSIGFFYGKPLLGASIHIPGTLTFFLSLMLIFLFGRRIICGWNCPCVGVRETMGAPFRENTIKGERAWTLRHVKWILTAIYLTLFLLLFFSPPYFQEVAAAFIGVVTIIYFTSFLLMPFSGSRNYCRWVCPFGGTFGILNKIGFYKIKAHRDLCIGCKQCDKACDMGIPVHSLVTEKGEVNVPDCMGCGRCITHCPKEVLSFHDIRSLFRGKERKADVGPVDRIVEFPVKGKSQEIPDVEEGQRASRG
jgi:polyferredoxin